MAKAAATPIKATSKATNIIRVGQRVRFGNPWNRHEGDVIEDRGPLDVGGRQVIRVRYFVDVSGSGQGEPFETEISAESAEVVG